MTEKKYNTITLLSDFGTADGTVGVVHSVIRQMAPSANIVDLTHEVDPFDVRGGSLTLARSVQFLCPGVIVAMVQPGAGTTQRRIAVEVAGGAAVLLGPDNGLLAPAVGLLGGTERAVVLDNAEYFLPTESTTFDGRDVFAPIAAHLCSGIALGDMGTEIDPNSLMPGLVPITSLETDADGIEVLTAEVLWVDRFGNAQLNVDPPEIEAWGHLLSMTVGGIRRTARRVVSFGELATGELGLLVDADGLISIVVDRASAAEELRLGGGDEVTLQAVSDSGTDPDEGVRTAVQIGRRSANGGDL